MKGLHILNGVLWAINAVVSTSWAHSWPLTFLALLGFVMSGFMYWMEATK